MANLSYKSDDLTGTVFGELLIRLRNQPRLCTLKRVKGLSKREFQEKYAANSYPVILEGLIPARLTDKEETNRLLRLTMGADVVTARYGAYADPVIYVGRRLARTTVDSFLRQFDNEKGNENHPYLANIELGERIVQLLGLTSPAYYSASDLRRPRLWLGPTGSITPLHKDGSDNFALQLFGRKRWVLFPIRDYPFLYMNQPNARSVPGFACSRVDIRKPDLERFPLYCFARPIEVEINAGETLYLPAGWSHYVETLSPALMVNYWVNNQYRLPAYLECADVPTPRSRKQ